MLTMPEIRPPVSRLPPHLSLPGRRTSPPTTAPVTVPVSQTSRVNYRCCSCRCSCRSQQRHRNDAPDPLRRPLLRRPKPNPPPPNATANANATPTTTPLRLLSPLRLSNALHLQHLPRTQPPRLPRARRLLLRLRRSPLPRRHPRLSHINLHRAVLPRSRAVHPAQPPAVRARTHTRCRGTALPRCTVRPAVSHHHDARGVRDVRADLAGRVRRAR